jgi:NACalpha-BTF3-like transcription factor
MGQIQSPDTMNAKKQVHAPSWQRWRTEEEPTVWVAFLMQQRQTYQEEARIAKIEYEAAQQEFEKSRPTHTGDLHLAREEQRVDDLRAHWQYLVEAVKELNGHLAAMECPKEGSLGNAGSNDAEQSTAENTGTVAPSAKPPSDAPSGATTEAA